MGDKVAQYWVVQVDPDTRREVRVEVDMRRLAARLGHKACRNRTGVSKCIGGIVKVTAVGENLRNTEAG